MEAIRMKAARVALGLVLCLGCVVGAAAACVAASGEACAAQHAGWVKSGSRWWYAQPGGGYARGWLKVGSSWYWFDSSGWMATGWLQQGAKWYYLKGSGAMATGWQRVGSTWYWLDSSGAMRTGWLQQGAKWYYLKGSGAMATGWQRVGSTWYWFDASGAMASSRWVGDYYLGASGAMATSQWVGAYYVGADGKWIPGYGQAPVTPASDFEYTIGDFELDGKVGTGSLLQAIEQEPRYRLNDRYGNCYAVTVGGSGGTLAFDCGHGVYITGYGGDRLDVVVPDEINGVKVVSVDLASWEAESQSIDVSRCSSLKALSAWAPNSVNFGSIKEVQSIYLGSGVALSNLDMTLLKKLAFVEFQGEFPQSFTFGSVANLESLGGIGLSSLNLKGAANLRKLRAKSGSLTDATLNLSGCTSLEEISLVGNRLTTFPASHFPNLKFLDLSGNPLTSTSRAQLEAWASQGDRDFFCSE